MKKIIIHEEYCIGCRLCEIHCLVAHSKSKEIIKAYKGEYPKPEPRIHVEEKSHLSFALQCRHCEDAPCLDACMSGAMHRDRDTNAVLCDEDKCVGCWMCVMVCPFGVAKPDTEKKKVASKCDLCAGKESPVCVKNCPNEAIVFEEAKIPLALPEAKKPAVVQAAKPETPGKTIPKHTSGFTEGEMKFRDFAPCSTYLIIGNSAAAVKAVEAIRENDRENKITIVSDEPYHAYSRPLISYLLGQKVKELQMYYRVAGGPQDFYLNNNVETLLGRKAVKIDTVKKCVILEDKSRICFEKLLVTTGGKPIVPEIKGGNLKGVFTFTTWADAEKIKKYIDENRVKNVIVIGGGLIGLKATEALLFLNEKGLKLSITIVELADRILSATFDRKASSIVEQELKKNGCAIITKNTVEKIIGVKSVNGVVLKNKKKIPADMLITAIGVSPDVFLARDTGIKINRGIIVDEHMQTNVPGIYAAGDCCEARDTLFNIIRPMAIWPNATRQGEIAGSNMSGARKSYKGSFAMNSVELCGIPTVSVGVTDPKEKGYEVMVYEPPVPEEQDAQKPAPKIYKKLVLKNNVIVGMIFVGDISRAGIYTGLIRDKVNVSSFRDNLLKDDFGLISLPKEYRKHMVSGSGIEV